MAFLPRDKLKPSSRLSSPRTDSTLKPLLELELMPELLLTSPYQEVAIGTLTVLLEPVLRPLPKLAGMVKALIQRLVPLPELT